MKIGILGGSFNPPHAGHLDAARSSARQLELDKLIVIPSGTPPHKVLPEGSPTALQRLEMTRLAFRDVPNCEISDIEVRRTGESYTIDTLRELCGVYPDAEFYLVVGTDMFLTLSRWKDANEIFRRATPAVTLRLFHLEAQIAAEAARLKSLGVAVEIIRNDTIETSSSELREELISRNWTRHLDYLVYSYIIENGLFGAKPNFDWLRLEAYRLLDDKRIRHVAGCEGEAVCLARRWGASLDEAREGAILHDITKRLDAEAQLALCDRYGIALDELSRSTPKILHGHTAAELAAERFNVSDAVKSAIKWHTTGHAGMTLLEKIIYLADYMEPNRDFDGVEKLRALAYRDIDAAMLLGLQMTVDDLTERGLAIDTNTLGAMNSLK
ncbi:MAG: nicotinate (nicotinamide) nucleotide adenylyltransferase [Oscillospiraceae bacterium]|jgi:nicotinate-nucleotide adenylyltransferase|nr:nicotinate (nicotinamide) nucleotide adenylyltransferase [Oscillospiraceae bacterium]